MMLTINKIIRDGLDSLESDLGIKIKKQEGYVLLDYCQINSPKTDPVVKECRGLILEENTLKVACRSFDRFFNYGEGNTQDFEFEVGNKVVEKVDGSLIRVWWSSILSEWVVSTRGTIFADSDVHGNNFTFEQLFKEVFVAHLNSKNCADFPVSSKLEKDFQSYCDQEFDSNHTYIFELATPYNRVVTRYPENRIVLTAIRDNSMGFYKSIRKDTFETPKEFPFGSWEDAISASKFLGNLEEGFVVVDASGIPLCKIKSPTYVAVHHIRGEGLNPKHISKLVWSGEVGEYLSYFPEDREILSPHLDRHLEVLDEISDLWENNKKLQDQKEFALAVKDTPYAGVMFLLKRGVKLEKILDNTSDKIKQQWLFQK